jgi:hypothetical protein
MKKLAYVNSFAAWLIISLALILFSGPAQAYVYDDFTSVGINPSLWVDNGPDTGYFSQPGDSYLYYSDSGFKNDRLKSYNPVSGAFSVSMQYSNFQTTNSWNPQPGQFLSSGVELMVAQGTNAVVVLEGQNAVKQFFTVISNINGTKTTLGTIYVSGVNSGWLRLDYNGILGTGGEVTSWYDAGAGWTELATYAPNFGLFSTAPIFQIAGYDPSPDGTSLSFQVNQVQLTPIPLPPSVLLLGTGLLSLAGWSRKLRKG